MFHGFLPGEKHIRQRLKLWEKRLGDQFHRIPLSLSLHKNIQKLIIKKDKLRIALMRNMYQNIELKRLNKKGKKIMEKKIF